MENLYKFQIWIQYQISGRRGLGPSRTRRVIGCCIQPPQKNLRGMSWTVSVLEKNTSITILALIAQEGSQLIDRKESRKNIVTNGVPALLVTVTGTTEEGESLIYKTVYIERNNTIYGIGGDARTDSPDFTTFFNSFKFTSSDSSSSTSQSAPTLNTGMIRIISPNGGETLKIGDTMQITWDTKDVPAGAQLDLELFEITSDKTVINAEGGCFNCTGSGLRSGVSAIHPVVNGVGSARYIVGKLYAGGYLKPGSHYIMKATVSKDGSPSECPAKFPTCTVDLSVDWSDTAFTLLN